LSRPVPARVGGIKAGTVESHRWGYEHFGYLLTATHRARGIFAGRGSYVLPLLKIAAALAVEKVGRHQG
jgi:hypothetical protein